MIVKLIKKVCCYALLWTRPLASALHFVVSTPCIQQWLMHGGWGKTRNGISNGTEYGMHGSHVTDI